MNSDQDPFLKAALPMKRPGQLLPGERRQTHAHQQPVRRRRTMQEMNAVEIQQYLDTAGQMTQNIMPAGSCYCLVIASPGGRVDYITTLPAGPTAAMLRDLAAHIEPAVAEEARMTNDE